MKKRIIISLFATMLITVPTFAADIDSMTLEELKAAYLELEAKYNELAGITTEEITEVSSEEYESWPEGVYKIGTDMSAGEYVLISNGGGYFQVASDSTGSFESIISNSVYETNTIITVSDGQYFTITDSEAYRIDACPELDTTKEGMFKVGLHIPAGEYKVHADEDGYMQVASDSSNSFSSIVSNSIFSGDSYITVSEGQYLTLSDAYILQ